MKNDVVVVIPVYKEVVDDEEMISLNYLFSHLYDYSIVFISFSNCSLNRYFSVAKLYEVTVTSVKFSSYYFQSVDTYNQLLISNKFYNSFKEFSFILIYQLDSLVFNDNIKYFKNLNVSYIGAPWVKKIDANRFFSGVGNGGLSLRKVDDFLKIFKSKYLFFKIYYIIKSNYKYSSVREKSFFYFKKNVFSKNFIFIFNINSYFFKNEDLFWGSVIPKKFEWFKVADTTEALKFSFEREPEFCFKQNGFNLPFGCHAWAKYDISFWKKNILVD